MHTNKTNIWFIFCCTFCYWFKKSLQKMPYIINIVFSFKFTKYWRLWIPADRKFQRIFFTEHSPSNLYLYFYRMCTFLFYILKWLIDWGIWSSKYKCTEISNMKNDLWIFFSVMEFKFWSILFIMLNINQNHCLG